MQTDKVKKRFAQAYEEYADAIFRHCYFRVSDREKAKDLMQETFVRTWKYIESGNNFSFKEIRPFLYKTATNLVIDEYRKNKGNASLDKMQEKGFDVEVDSGFEESIDTKLAIDRITNVLDQLDDKYKEVIVMRYIDGLTPKEISKITDDTANNISVKLNRATKQIKKIIQHEG